MAVATAPCGMHTAKNSLFEWFFLPVVRVGKKKEKKKKTLTITMKMSLGVSIISCSRTMCGCRQSLRMLISRFTFSSISRAWILPRFRIFTATLCPVNMCSPTASTHTNKYIQNQEARRNSENRKHAHTSCMTVIRYCLDRINGYSVNICKAGGVGSAE